MSCPPPAKNISRCPGRTSPSRTDRRLHPAGSSKGKGCLRTFSDAASVMSNTAVVVVRVMSVLRLFYTMARYSSRPSFLAVCSRGNPSGKTNMATTKNAIISPIVARVGVDLSSMDASLGVCFCFGSPRPRGKSALNSVHEGVRCLSTRAIR